MTVKIDKEAEWRVAQLREEITKIKHDIREILDDLDYLYVIQAKKSGRWQTISERLDYEGMRVGCGLSVPSATRSPITFKTYEVAKDYFDYEFAPLPKDRKDCEIVAVRKTDIGGPLGREK